jgi:hypothetical protein
MANRNTGNGQEVTQPRPQTDPQEGQEEQSL